MANEHGGISSKYSTRAGITQSDKNFELLLLYAIDVADELLAGITSVVLLPLLPLFSDSMSLVGVLVTEVDDAVVEETAVYGYCGC